MKLICFLFLGLFLTAATAFSQSFWDGMTSGSWKGSGTLMGSEANFYMKWTWELDGNFLKLEFQNKRTSPSGQELVLDAHAYYQSINDSVVEGTWFDSRGVTFPVRGVLKGSTFTVTWGSPETEQGKTIYVLDSVTEIAVTDYFLRDTTFVKDQVPIYV